MDLIPTPRLKRSPASSRDFSSQRRAYLDTYAKKRNPTLATKTEPKKTIDLSVSAAQVSMPLHNPNAVVFNKTEAQTAKLPASKPSSERETQNHSVIPVQTSTFNTTQQKMTPPVKSEIKNDINRMDFTPAFQKQTDQKTLLQQVKTESFEDLPGTTSYGTPEQISDSNDQRISANLRALYMDEDSLTAALVKNSSSSSISHMRTIVASAFACGVIAVSLFTFFGQAGSQPVVAQPVDSPVIEVQAPSVNKPSQASSLVNASKRIASNPDQPNNIVISGIGVNAPVEAVGMTPDGLMGVPKSYGVVGWYNKGVLPGQKGPAVLAGHFTGGYGGVFDKLGDIKDGDLITTTNGKGQSFTFKVTKKAEYDRDKVPMAELFKMGDGPRLEIITCSGKWQAKNYDKRLVVTAELVR